MLATAVLEMIPESLKLPSSHSSFFFNNTDAVFVFVLAGYFIVHFFEHTAAPHFHFGEETHHAEISHAHASYAALLGLMIHTFFDGVAIASGLLVSTWLGGVIFVAIFLHKIPEGFTVASLMLASGQSRMGGFYVLGDPGGNYAAGHGADVSAARCCGGRLAAFGGGDAVRGRVRSDPRGEPGTGDGDGGARLRGSGNPAGAEDAVPRVKFRHPVDR